jgi:hypothetical protein
VAGVAKGFLHHGIQIGSGNYPASYPVGTGALSPAVKWPGCEADHSLSLSAEMKFDSTHWMHKAITMRRHSSK